MLAVRLTALIACVLSLSAIFARIAANFHFGDPWHVITSGAEWESLLIVWRGIHDLPAYMDRLAIPYAASIYNWLFYQSYGAWTAMLLKLFALDEAWLPWVARGMTLMIVTAASLLARWHFAQPLKTSAAGPALRGLPEAYALLLGFGPLMGFWDITVRSDPGAMALEMAAAAVFIGLWPSRRLAAVLSAALFCYLSWSFKQNSVYTVGAIGLFLMFRREWGLAAILGAVMGCAWSVTLALGGALYRLDVLLSDFTLVFSARQGLHNLLMVMVKVLPIVAPLPVALVLLLADSSRRRSFFADDRALFATLAATLSTSMATVGNFHTGAAENYFFTASFYLALLLLCLLGHLSAEGKVPRPAQGILSAGWLGLSAALISLLAGFNGVISLQTQHQHVLNGLRCSEGAARPIYADWPYLHLPWMLKDNPNFVLSWQYEAERAIGKPFERGGIGGLLQSGYFATLLIGGTPPPATLDGAALADHYSYDASACDDFNVFRRRD